MQDKKKITYAQAKPYITVFVIVIVGVLLVFGSLEPTVTVDDLNINISCIQGMKIPLSEVESITLLEQSMNDIGVGRRNFGFGGFGSTLKGNFSSQALGTHHLYVQADSSPTIKVARKGGGDVYISFRDPIKTEQVFALLKGD